MRRMDKIELDKYLEYLWVVNISERTGFNYWNEEDFVEVLLNIEGTIPAITRRTKIMRVFWRNLYPRNDFRDFLSLFEY